MTIRRTLSVCPYCLKRVGAYIVRRGGNYYMDKSCSEHGDFSTIIWRGDEPALESWGGYTPPADGRAPDCPDGCGLCAGHLQKTCCALVEVTGRCNLRCPICFSESGDDKPEPSVETLYGIFRRLAARGSAFVQLSGGEPSIRDELPDIVAAARRAGCTTVQLNSNGLRLGADPAFTRALRDAGLSFVFMQFDGTGDAIYEKLRGAPLLDAKREAIRVCGENRIGVTLVPTVVPGVNDLDIGNIISFALERSPVVRGVHFQPVSYFGRYPAPPRDCDRLTLPDILRAIQTQTSGRFNVSDFTPSSCDHPRCGFHGDFAVLPNTILKLKKKPSAACCGDAPDTHLKNRNFIARRWKMSDESDPAPGADYRNMDTFLHRVKSHGFTITAMAFQDAYNLDIERLRRCSLHVFDGERTIPFCAKYLTAAYEL